jgi:hypothetical protein
VPTEYILRIHFHVHSLTPSEERLTPTWKGRTLMSPENLINLTNETSPRKTGKHVLIFRIPANSVIPEPVFLDAQ